MPNVSFINLVKANIHNKKSQQLHITSAAFLVSMFSCVELCSCGAAAVHCQCEPVGQPGQFEHRLHWDSSFYYCQGLVTTETNYFFLAIRVSNNNLE